MKIKILYCENNTDGTLGGSYYSLYYLVTGLDRDRYEPVVMFYAENPLVDRLRDERIEVHIVEKPRAVVLGRENTASPRRLLQPLQRVANLARLLLLPAIRNAFLLRRGGFGLVHLNNSIRFNNEWMLATRLARIPCVTHERGINQSYEAAARYFARSLAGIICISDGVRKNMIEKQVDLPHMVTIHNALNPRVLRVTAAPTEIRQLHGIAPDAPLLGIVGNIKAWKGQRIVVEAMARVVERIPSACCLLVGDAAEADRYYEQELRGLVRKLGLEDRVVFTGFRMNVPDYINAMQIVLHSSIEPEPFGRVFLEAMALSKPVIGANAGGVPEIIVPGETGLLVEPGNADDMARAILQLLPDPDACARMGRAGYARLRERFSMEKHVSAVQALYSRIISHE
jgi:glycosyltransferase involved in cell wall biosynthesis